MSAPTQEDWKKVAALVDSFFKRADAEPFIAPVDYQGLGLHDYPKVIKQPMDLGTIKKKLAAGKYKSLTQVGEDVRLVWTNCMTYNADGSDFYKLADSLHKKWDDKWTKLLADTTTPPDIASSEAKATLQGKRDFAKSLYNISKEELGRVLVEVESKCPAAIIRNSEEDEIELNVDKIPPALLQELHVFVTQAKGNGKKGNAAKNKDKQTKKQKT